MSGVASSKTAASTCVVAIDGSAAASALTSKQFLLSSPAGAYTTARTCGNARRLFEWETHVTRTAASVEAMLSDPTVNEQDRPSLLAALAKPEALRPRLDATVSAAVREYKRTHGDGDELKVTVLVTWSCSDPATSGSDPKTSGSVSCHVTALPPLPTPPVKVEVRGSPRENAAAKDSSWVASRAPLEALMRSDINELLLATDSGELLEGSQTNFFALVDGAVHTAGDGVLAGTVRRLLLEVCEREGIPVVLRPPRLEDAGRWEGALISSTSRLALPIDQLFVPREGHPSDESDLRVEFANGPGSLAARLRALVRDEVVVHSTEIA